MNTYLNKLITSYQQQQPIVFENINTITSDNIIKNEINDINDDIIKKNLEKLVIIKLNGGLGTSMGCVGPKSMMMVKDNMNFLDIIINQIIMLNKKYNVDIPLIFMNSLNTCEDTINHCSKYNDNISIYHFNQNFLPRMDCDFKPLALEYNDTTKKYFYPPGHGDIYNAFYNSDLYSMMKNRGKEYVFISNADNLGSTIDKNILNSMIVNDIDFSLEVVEKTLKDVKGGTFINNNGNILLLEVAQVPKKNLIEFYDITKFKYFNTNNLWIKLDCFSKDIVMDVIYNPKKVDNIDVVQLEVAMGSAIQSFENSKIFLVDRTRFLPVKKHVDYNNITSNNYKLDEMYHMIKVE